MHASAPRKPGGKVRAARLTDLAALGELSRLVPDRGRRLALARPAGQRPADRRVQPVPAAARRVPAARPACSSTRRTAAIAGLVRVERESGRDEWTIVELDAVGHRRRRPATSATGSSSSSCAKARSAAPRASTSPAPTRTATSSCSCRPGSCATARSGSCTGPPDQPLPAPWTDAAAAEGADPARPARSMRSRCIAALRGRDAGAGPAPGGDPAPRLGAPGPQLARPALSLAPILRFADVEAFVQEAPDGGGRHGARRLRPDRRRQGGPAALPEGPRAGRRSTSGHSSSFGLGIDRAARTTERRRRRPNHGVIAPVRTYEAPVDRRLEEAGFDVDRDVTLLMKETLVRVAEPALVPAGVRSPGGRPVEAHDAAIRRSRQREKRSTTSTRCSSALPPEIVDAVHALPDREDADRGRHGPRPAARGALPGPRGRRCSIARSTRPTSQLRRRAHRHVRRRQPRRHRADAPPHQRDPQPRAARSSG